VLKSSGAFDFPRQAENDVDETTRKAIHVTRQQKHLQDHKNGHRYYKNSRRQAIDKLVPLERDALYWQRIDGRQPSCDHPQQTKQPDYNWMQSGELHSPFNRCAKGA